MAARIQVLCTPSADRGGGRLPVCGFWFEPAAAPAGVMATPAWSHRFGRPPGTAGLTWSRCPTSSQQRAKLSRCPIPSRHWIMQRRASPPCRNSAVRTAPSTAARSAGRPAPLTRTVVCLALPRCSPASPKLAHQPPGLIPADVDSVAVQHDVPLADPVDAALHLVHRCEPRLERFIAHPPGRGGRELATRRRWPGGAASACPAAGA